MNTKTAPEASTGRIVSKFWPSSLFMVLILRFFGRLIM